MINKHRTTIWKRFKTTKFSSLMQKKMLMVRLLNLLNWYLDFCQCKSLNLQKKKLSNISVKKEFSLLRFFLSYQCFDGYLLFGLFRVSSHRYFDGFKMRYFDGFTMLYRVRLGFWVIWGEILFQLMFKIYFTVYLSDQLTC